jgi:hypothetical protein
MSDPKWKPFDDCCSNCGSSDIKVLTTARAKNCANDADDVRCNGCNQVGYITVYDSDEGCEVYVMWHEEYCDEDCHCDWCNKKYHDHKESSKQD